MKLTKKALVLSLLAMLLCVSMLIGTTFAWFTDTATSSNNRIVAGNLDVDLVMYNGTDYVSIAGGSGDIFDTAAIAQNKPASLWEPGKTQIVYLGVQNKGNLAIKYNIILDVTDTDATDGVNLADVLDYAIIDGAEAGTTSSPSYADWAAVSAAAASTGVIGTLMGEANPARITAASNGTLDEIRNGTKDETDYFVLAVHMQETAGNEYQGKEIVIDLSVVATQKDAEADSFGPEYDEPAILPEVPVAIHDIVTRTIAAAEVTTDTTGETPVSKATVVAATEITSTDATSSVPADTTVTLTGYTASGEDKTDSVTGLTRTIETTDSSVTSLTLDIGYKATVTTTANDVVVGTEEYAVHTFGKVVENIVNVGTGLTNVKVTHGTTQMTKANNTTAKADGTYYYDSETGKLYIWSKTYSEYSVSWDAPDYVASVGSTGYTSLDAALKAAKEGETVRVLKDVTSDDGFKITKSISLDTNGKTITVNSGSNVNNRAFRVDSGTFTVYGGGKIVAIGAGTTSSNGTGCYGAFRVEANGELVASDLTLTNARPWGLNVKVLGGTATLTNVTINSSYGGGIEVTEADLGAQSKKGSATLTDCTFTQTGYFDHCSTTLSVSGGSELTVNSGSYTSDNYALYVFSSGGVINIKDGTFSGNKDGVAIVAAIDTNTYPEYAGGLVIEGGTFNGGYAITSPAYMTITGGTFDHDPSDYVDSEHVVEDNGDGTWTVKSGIQLARAYAIAAGANEADIEDGKGAYVFATMSDGVVYVYYSDGMVDLYNMSGYNGKNGTGTDDPTYYIFGGLVKVDGMTQSSFATTSTVTKVKFTGNLNNGGYKGFAGNTSVTDVDFGGMTSIPNRLFYQANGLVSVTIPNTVTSMSVSVFQQCENLETVVLPDSITAIPSGFVYECRKLTSINIPSSVTTIGDNGLRATKLSTVTIPSSVKTIGAQAFRDCEELTSVVINIESTEGLQVATNAFSNVASPYPSCTMTFANSDVYTYFTDLGLSSANHIIFVDPSAN